jgi:hypothetical protein
MASVVEQRLKAIYGAVVSEAVPEDMLSLLSALDTPGADAGASGACPMGDTENGRTDIHCGVHR